MALRVRSGFVIEHKNKVYEEGETVPEDCASDWGHAIEETAPAKKPPTKDEDKTDVKDKA